MLEKQAFVRNYDVKLRAKSPKKQAINFYLTYSIIF